MHDRRLTWIVVALLLCLVHPALAAEVQEKPGAKGASAELNERYVDPELDVGVWVERFEVESREVFAARHDVLKATGISAGDVVADIGAGTGLYTRLFAEAVGDDGWVVAVDISPRFLEHINRTAAEAGLDNITSVLGQVDSITLPPNSVNHAFVCDTYHHLEEVEPMLASIHRALVPGGTFVVIEFERIPGVSRPWILDHTRAGKEVFRAEIEAAGFEFVEEVEIPGFVENYFIKFRK